LVAALAGQEAWPPKNPAHVDTGVALSVRLAGSVTDQATFHRELTKLANRGHSVPCRQHNELFDATVELPYPNPATPFFKTSH
jgi:hypothetical protein